MSKDIQRDSTSTSIPAEINTTLENIDILGLNIRVSTGDVEFWGDMFVLKEHGRETGDWVVCRRIISLAYRLYPLQCLESPPTSMRNAGILPSVGDKGGHCPVSNTRRTVCK